MTGRRDEYQRDYRLRSSERNGSGVSAKGA